jgi:hypothetical protein
MHDKEANSMFHAEQLPVEVVAELIMTAERELAAFYEAVFSGYGPKQARLAAHGWIDELETMDWPVDGALPNWRHVTIVSADCLASRIIDHSPSMGAQRLPRG